MTRQEIWQEMGKIAQKIRAGKATLEEAARYEALEREYYAAPAPIIPAIKSMFDLPVARVMWKEDGRDRGC